MCVRWYERVFWCKIPSDLPMRFMRRVSLLSALPLILLCSACVRQTNLRPEDVMIRASLAVPTLSSARIAATADMTYMHDGRTVEGQVKASGVLRDGGKQSQFDVEFDGTVTDARVTYSIKGAGDLVAAGQDQTYARVRSLTSEPMHPLLRMLRIDALIGKWLRFPSGGNVTVASVTPDPSFLKAQSEVVEVLEDLGMSVIHGRDAYHYKVALDNEKLLSFMRADATQRGEAWDEASARKSLEAFHPTGELWIDATDFFIHRIDWTLPEPEADFVPPEQLFGTLSVQFTDHNNAPDIELPTDAQDFPLPR